MTVVRRKGRHHRRRIALLATLTTIAAGLVFVIAASTASLPGSNFEIDTSANLKVDGAAPSIDWASVTEGRRADLATGQNDDSYAGGSKEDTVCPGTTTGSIPNNKSDLLTFGAYVESQANGPGFLNLFWHRVNEPNGTTLMDFELNQSGADCGNGVNKVRTPGDLLLEYSIDQGGAEATITAREWNGSVWGEQVPVPDQALGTINQTVIPAAESDGLSATPVAARTFGEMQLDLDFIFDSGECESFGSAMLKSRSSDAGPSQLKDFIRPVPVNITNCGKVIIRKQTDPDEASNTTTFPYTKAFATDPASENTFSLADDGVKEFTGVLFGSGHTVTEGDLPAGWDFASLNCDASSGVTPSIVGKTVTFAIDNSADILDCTYTNRARGTIIVEKITDDSFGSFSFTSTNLSPSPFVLATTAAGDGGKASRMFANLNPGTYNVAETVPANWKLVSSSCSDGSPVSAIELGGGETVTCTFHDARERGAIEITKTRMHKAAGGSAPHEGVTFTVTGGELPAGGVTAVTDANGKACVDNLLDGSYTVTETLPAGYHAEGALAKSASVVDEATCAAGPKAGVSFVNVPLTNLTVSVDSQIDGGTASTIDCGDASDPVETGANGDGSKSKVDLEPGTYTCVVVIDP